MLVGDYLKILSYKIYQLSIIGFILWFKKAYKVDHYNKNDVFSL